MVELQGFPGVEGLGMAWPGKLEGQPISDLMPEGRDTLQPTVARLFKAVADYSLVQGKHACGRVIESRFACLNPVQAQILKLLGLASPAELFAQSVLS
jgi:hypothetical protein